MKNNTNTQKNETILIYSIIAIIAIGTALAGIFSNNLSGFQF